MSEVQNSGNKWMNRVPNLAIKVVVLVGCSIALWLVVSVSLFITVVQFIHYAVFGNPNKALDQVSNTLVAFTLQVLRYYLLLSHDIPFPFTPLQTDTPSATEKTINPAPPADTAAKEAEIVVPAAAPAAKAAAPAADIVVPPAAKPAKSATKSTTSAKKPKAKKATPAKPPAKPSTS